MTHVIDDQAQPRQPIYHCDTCGTPIYAGDDSHVLNDDNYRVCFPCFDVWWAKGAAKSKRKNKAKDTGK